MKIHIRTAKKVRGFTLIETLVSAFVISMVVLGPLTLASNVAAYARTTKDTLTATYLAQESIELLRHQQDSVYIRCVQESGTFCTTTGTETYSQAAWRIFRDRLNNTSGVSCFASENASGCAYDAIHMTTNEESVPTKYAGSSSLCGTLAVETSSNLYVCSTAHGSGAGYTPTTFSRIVSITSIPTIGEGTSEQNYHDDLRVTVTVSWRTIHGYQKQIEVIDFLHARP